MSKNKDEPNLLHLSETARKCKLYLVDDDLIDLDEEEVLEELDSLIQYDDLDDEFIF
jgi:hypothetical protein